MTGDPRPGDIFFCGAVATGLAIAIFHTNPWGTSLAIGLAVGWYLNEQVRVAEVKKAKRDDEEWERRNRT